MFSPMKNAWRAAAAFALLCSAPAQAGHFGVVTKGDGYIYTRLGNQTNLTTKTTGGVMFEGGGLDVNRAYEWMCQHAGNGDFLIIRSYGTADYNPYITRLCPGINSVSTLLLFKRTASFDPFVLSVLQHAEALFIAGGDQSSYVRLWQDTPVSAAINALAAQGVTVGGTSAGNAILAQFAFSALYGTVFSHNALANCYDKHITIDDGFLNLSPLTAATITDDHFVTRNRMGRLVTFLARIAQSGLVSQAFGIAMNEHTAYLMEPDGHGHVVGGSTGYFIRTPGPPEICAEDTPLTFTSLPVYRVRAGDSFDVAKWQGQGGTAYMVSATNGVLSSTQKGGHIY
jgi:cyanophycinase